MTAESNSTKLSEPKASNAGLWAAKAPASETPHSTNIQTNVTACSRNMCCRNSAGDEHCSLLNSVCGSPIWTSCDIGSENARSHYPHGDGLFAGDDNNPVPDLGG